MDRKGRLAVLPLDDRIASALLDELPEAERFDSWRLVRPDGSILGYAVVRGRVPDALYRFVAEHRKLLGRLVPDGPAPRRFP
jgi:hypothetical protein